MSVKTYNPREVSYIFGPDEIGGFADGTFISAARNEDSASYQRAAKGSGTRTLTSDRSGRITATLQQTSPSNAVFASALAILELSGSNDTRNALIKDSGGNDLHEAATAWVVRQPDTEYANELSNREWIVETDELIMNTLGHSS